MTTSQFLEDGLCTQSISSNVKFTYDPNPEMEMFRRHAISLIRETSRAFSRKVKNGEIPSIVRNLSRDPGKQKHPSIRKKDCYIFLEDYSVLNPKAKKEKKYSALPITPTEMRDDPLWFKDIFSGVANKSICTIIIEHVINRWTVKLYRDGKLPPRVDFSKHTVNLKKNYLKYDFYKDEINFKDFNKNTITLKLNKSKSQLIHFSKWKDSIKQEIINADEKENSKRLEEGRPPVKRKSTIEERMNTRTWGANIVFYNRHIIPFVSVDHYCYSPKAFWGPDLNKTKEFFLTFPSEFNGEMYFERPEEYVKLEKLSNDLHDLKEETLKPRPEHRSNTYVKFKGKNIPCNSWGRRKITELQNKIKKKRFKILLNHPVINEIIDYIKSNNYGLALDTVKTGNTHGSWGQDHFQQVMEAKSRKDVFPMVKVPARWTSSKCRKCGNKDLDNVSGKGRETFKCTNPSCGYEAVAHIEAAKNISEEAFRLWKKTNTR